MRIHTDIIEREHLDSTVADLGGVRVEASRHGSRQRDHAWEVSLVATPRVGRRYRNTGQSGASEDAAATWDEWGVFFARLFDTDPTATCYAYVGRAHFHWSTGERFWIANRAEPGLPEDDRHDQHRFNHSTAMFPSYVESECACGAVRRHLTRGVWDDVREVVGA